ncbi:heparinase II/III domain-containing protein [Gephyromycinifex aptenodytis]|uniref:heparinase II/III domain-containing protein n=1 Tax=Gephyromycinifex aptenodytis TaxID=2716227 RepID=UPI00144844D8|nr:heparinase II/III family protein [Gephyromycinifex aptenodytis]
MHCAALRTITVGALVATMAGAGSVATARPITSDAARKQPRYLCSNLEFGNPTEDVLKDVYRWGIYADKVGNGRGDIDWNLDPHKQVSWRMWLNALRWLGKAVDAAGKGNAQARAHALAITRDWMNDHQKDWTGDDTVTEGAMHRTNMLLCLRQAVASPNGKLSPDLAWIDAAIERHGKWLTAHYSGVGNHGTNESITLVGVGVTLHRREFTDLGVRRLREALPLTIDAQGATDEQSTGYVLLNYDLWMRARDTLREAQVAADLQRQIDVSLARLATFFAHATNSLGYHHQIGDSERRRLRPLVGTPHEYIATGGRSGKPLSNRVAIYRAGYVFGRSGWGTASTPLIDESSYSLRFGRAKRAHGHDDKTSITYQARRRDVLIDPGLGELNRDAWREYQTGFAAHNALVAPGMSRAPAALTSSSLSPKADTFVVTDTPGKGFQRSRTAMFLRGPEALLVVDAATAPKVTTFSQHWHLPTDASVRIARNAATALVGSKRTEKTMVIPLVVGAKGDIPRLRTVTGSTNPIQGWHWHTIFEKKPAPTVSGQIKARSVRVGALVVPAGAKDAVRVRTTVSAGGTTTWTIRVGGNTAIVGHRADGTLIRVR